MMTLLFICEHNSARSQMAEAYLNHFGGDELRAESAGLEPGTLNPYVVEVLAEDGLDISAKVPQSVFHLFTQGRRFDAVITVCSPEVGGKCPIFPGRVKRWSWPFPDPSALTGDRERNLAETRAIRDAIKEKIRWFVDQFEEKGIRLFIE
jgi:arsenate reductase (thioredoxin)